MSADAPDDDVLSPQDAAQVRSLDAVRGHLVADAKSWAAQLDQLCGIAGAAGRRADPPVAAAGAGRVLADRAR